MNREFRPESGSLVRLGQVDEFNLGQMLVSPARRQIQVGDETRMLEPRVMQVLVALAEARPNVVPRDDLAQACWGGVAVGDDAMNRCIVSLRRLAREFDPQPFAIETVARVGYALKETGSGEPRGGKVLGRRSALALAAAVVAAGAALLLWHPWRLDEVSVSVVAASANADSQGLARDLTAKLGMLHSVSEGAIRLLDSGSSANGAFRFQVDASDHGADIQSNLVFLNNRGEVLWSGDFRQPRTSLSDLELQVAYTAGKVLECEREIASDRTGIDRQSAKLYLNGCANFADANEQSVRELDKVFEQVTRSAPAFRPAWHKLLLAETFILDLPDRSEADKARARQLLAAAPRDGATMPSIDLLRAGLLASNAIAERMRLVEDAVHKAPDDGEVAPVYVAMLARAGRLNDAIAEARKAVRLDPLSPQNREGLVVHLASVGRIPEAIAELHQAEALWPGSLVVRETRYLLYLRFADPREAIRLRGSGDAAALQDAFLAAREARTRENVEKAVTDARSKYATDWRWISHSAQVFGEFGRDEELFSILLNWDQPDGVDAVTDVLFRPSLHNFRRDPRFMRVAKRLGLLDYWQNSGHWPDLCKEPDLPYDCAAEAAKIAAEVES